MIVPDKLAKDYRELQYIEGIGKSKITLSEQQVILLLNVEFA